MDYFLDSPNVQPCLLPEYEHLGNVLRDIDVSAACSGCEMCVVIDADSEMGLGFLSDPGKLCGTEQ